MFESGIKVTDLIAEVRKSADISTPVSEDFLIESYNRTEQLLYSEIIKEQAYIADFEADEGIFDFDLSSVSHISAAPLRYEDIVSVYIDERELSPTNLNSVSVMRNSFCKNGDYLRINSCGGNLKVVYNIRPSMAERSVTTVKKSIPLIDFTKGFTNDDIACYPEVGSPYFYYVLTRGVDLSGVIPKNAEITFDSVSVGNDSLSPVSYAVTKANVEAQSPQVMKIYNYSAGTGVFSFSYISYAYIGNSSFTEFGTYIKDNGSLTLIIDYSESVLSERTIKLPYEFIDMMRCKLKSDMYNAANDESNAAKWLDEYNNYLENFKAYLQARTSEWGR